MYERMDVVGRNLKWGNRRACGMTSESEGDA